MIREEETFRRSSDAFVKLRKATISVGTSVCASVCPHGTARLPLDGFPKSAEKIQVSLKSDQNNGTLRADRYTFVIMSRSVLLRMNNVQTEAVEKIKTHILCSITFFFSEIKPFVR